MTTRETLVKELHQLCQRLGVRAGVLVVMTPEEHALVAIVCPETDRIPDGVKITVNIKKGYVEADGKQFAIEPVPPFMQRIIDAGGLVEYAKNLKEVPVCTKSRR